VLVIGPAAYWSLANAFYNLYTRSVAEPALKGYLANIANFEIYQDQNAQSLTNAPRSGAPVVTGAGQTGSSIATSGWGASIANLLNVGEVITIAGVHAVNPQNRQSTGVLQNFVVTAAASSNGSGLATLSLYPAIITSGAYQTVDVSPANNAGINFLTGTPSATNPNGIGFVKDAFGLVCVPLELPQGVDFAARETYRGISMSIVRDFDINTYQYPCRIDVLYGTACFYPELACRLTG
jgi:hypothetical protein